MMPVASSIVIKIGGRAQTDVRLAPALAARWAAWRVATAEQQGGDASATVFCVVHGGGDDVTALQRAAGVEPTFVGGRRVTAPDDIDRLRMALSGLANKRLVAALGGAGVRAVGLSGEDGPLLVAEPIADSTLGAVGTVCAVDTSLVAMLVSAGYLPVIAPVAAARSGSVAAHPPTATPALNINGDDAAAAVAVALSAGELLLVSDVPGVRVDGQRVVELTPPMAERAIARGEIAGGMEAKVHAALDALAHGVGRVRIGPLDMLTSDDAGTAVVRACDDGAVVGDASSQEVAA
jgi:acetylglutamate kinase